MPVPSHCFCMSLWLRTRRSGVRVTPGAPKNQWFRKVSGLNLSSTFHQFGDAFRLRTLLARSFHDATFKVGHGLALVFRDHFHVIAKRGRRVSVPHLALGVFDGAVRLKHVEAVERMAR